MPQWLQWTLIIAGLIAIVVLVAFITRQSRALRQHNATRRKNDAFMAERREKMVESIRVIAMAVEEDQVEYSEACLRLKGLLDHVAPELLQRSPYSVFLDVHDRISHMPTHRARKKTDKRFVEKMDEERFAVEKEFRDAIRRAATAIREYDFSDHL